MKGPKTPFLKQISEKSISGKVDIFELEVFGRFFNEVETRLEIFFVKFEPDLRKVDVFQFLKIDFFKILKIDVFGRFQNSANQNS